MPTSSSSSSITSMDFRRTLASKKPPKFIFSYRGNHSPSTRKPKFYDTHMHEKLLLKCVKIIPSLPDFFTRCALDAMEANSDTQKASILNHVVQKCKVWGNTTVSIANEKDLQDAIRNQVGRLPLSVASLLLFGKSEEFTLNDPPAAAFSVTGAKGKLDLYFGIEENANATQDLKLVKQMLETRGASPMAWELKGLAAGDLTTMTAVVSQEGPYRWIHCKKSSAACAKSHHWSGHKLSVSGAPTGPDAKLPVELEKELYLQAAKCSKFISKKSKTTKESQPDKGRWVCQQVWAGAVASDTTLVVIRSGAWEIYGIRIRETQTLLLSPVIDVQKQPEYLLLQAGLVIFAYKDAVERYKAWNSGEDPFRSLEYDYPDMVLRKSRKPEAVGPEGIHFDIEATFKGGISRIQLVSSGQYYFQIESSGMNFTRDQEFTEAGKVNFTGPPQAVLQLQEDQSSQSESVCEGVLTVDQSSQSESVCEGVLTVLGRQYRVVVKMAWADAGVVSLENEYAIYCELSKSPKIRRGLAWSLGLYKHEVEVNTQSSMAGSYHCLWVMMWGGKDLTRYKIISDKVGARFQGILSHVHKTGWAHGNLKAKHLLWDDVTETITILGWRHSQKVDKDSELKIQDYYQLKSILKRGERSRKKGAEKRKALAKRA